MAGSVNKVILVGNLGKDPDVRRLNSGDQVVSFSVATSETWRDKTSGERKEKTEWHNVVIFNENLGKVAEQYCKKGTKVYLEGQLQTRKWQDQSGNDRYTTEVVLQRFRGELQLLDSARRRRGPPELPRRGARRRRELRPLRPRRPPPGAIQRRQRGADRRRHSVLSSPLPLGEGSGVRVRRALLAILDAPPRNAASRRAPRASIRRSCPDRVAGFPVRQKCRRLAFAQSRFRYTASCVANGSAVVAGAGPFVSAALLAPQYARRVGVREGVKHDFPFRFSKSMVCCLLSIRRGRRLCFTRQA